MSLFEGRGGADCCGVGFVANQLEFVSPVGDQGSGDGRHLPVAYAGSVWADQLECVSPVGDQGSGVIRRLRGLYFFGVSGSTGVCVACRRPM